MDERDRLMRYERMHQDLVDEYAQACAQMEDLRQRGLAKGATFKTLLARKLTLREWLDTYERYGL